MTAAPPRWLVRIDARYLTRTARVRGVGPGELVRHLVDELGLDPAEARGVVLGAVNPDVWVVRGLEAFLGLKPGASERPSWPGWEGAARPPAGPEVYPPPHSPAA